MTESVESLNARLSLAMGGGTLSDLLAQQKWLAFSMVVDYLDQLSEAIDLVHEQGFIHRNLNPSTILLTAEGHLVILGLKSASSRKDPRFYRREARWASYGDTRITTLAYMAPEQMLEGELLAPEARHFSNIAGMDRNIDGRADLYSLGVILYQMVTGVLPFQAETAEQMALKHLRMPPPSPRQFRPDLPIAAEQVMLRALAKRAADRYVRAQDLATAFGVALIAADIQLETSSQYSHDNDIDESQSTNPIPAVNVTPSSSSTDDAATPISPLSRAAQEAFPAESLSPAIQEIFSSAPESPVRTVSRVWEASINSFAFLEPPASPVPTSTSTGAQPAVAQTDQRSAAERISITPLPATNTTGTLALSNFQQGNTGTLKLTGPAKIVQVPVAGQPGLYVTGLLPVFPQQPSPSEALASVPLTQGGQNSRARLIAAIASAERSVARINPSAKARIILTLAVVVMLVVFGSGLFWFIHTHSSQTNKQSVPTITPNLKATATARSIATANANVILTDPLSQNIHNWPIATTGSMIYIFKGNAYHITDNNPTQGAPAILPDEILHSSFAYTLTMEEIKGDDTSLNNEFGMIIRANSQNKNGKIITTFYSFEVLNTKSGEYQFWKYDNSKGSSGTPWTKLWHQSFGKEFHQGHGPGSINTFKIFVNGKSFTLILNGKQIATVRDNSCTASLCSSGGVGMLVNLRGTEVAFSNLRLTHS